MIAMADNCTPICAHSRCKRLPGYAPMLLTQCEECGIIIMHAGSAFDSTRNVYENYYRNEMSMRFEFGIEFIIRLFRLFRAFKIATIYPKARSSLDIGSGRGYTLFYLKKYFGYTRATGTQIAPAAIVFSRNKLRLDIRDNDLLNIEFDNTRFDLVTMWHVLEHANNPDRYVGRIYNLLNKHGKFIVEVPNFASWSSRLTTRYWLGLDPKYHRSCFTPSTLQAVLTKFGFTIKTVHTHSLEYSTFISVQSIVSRITHTDQFFFKWLQEPRADWRLLPHILLFLILTPLCSILNLLLYFSLLGEVVLVIAEKK